MIFKKKHKKLLILIQIIQLLLKLSKKDMEISKL